MPLNVPCARLYAITRMDVAADFTMGIWVDAVEMANVGVGIGFLGTVRVGEVGKGWAITATLYLLFAGALILFYFSAILGAGDFLVKELLFWEGVLVHGCDCVWGWGLGLGPSLPPSSRYVFIFLIKEG